MTQIMRSTTMRSHLEDVTSSIVVSRVYLRWARGDGGLSHFMPKDTIDVIRSGLDLYNKLCDTFLIMRCGSLIRSYYFIYILFIPGTRNVFHLPHRHHHQMKCDTYRSRAHALRET